MIGMHASKQAEHSKFKQGPTFVTISPKQQQYNNLECTSSFGPSPCHTQQYLVDYLYQ